MEGKAGDPSGPSDGSSGVPGRSAPTVYCRFCGAGGLVPVKVEGKAADAGVALGINAGVVGANAAVTPRSSQKTSFDSTHCRTCLEIDVACSFEPKRASAWVDGLQTTFLLPKEFLAAASSFGATGLDLELALKGAAERAAKCKRDLAKSGGRNPCKNQFLGFPSTLRIRGEKILVHLIMGPADEKNGEFCVRVSYGGGNAPCR